MHGLGRVVPCSASTTPSRTARVDCGVVGEVVGGSFTRKGETSAPIPPYKQGKQGQFAHLPVAVPSSRISPTPPLPKAPPPSPPAPPTPSSSFSTPAMAPKAE